MTFDKVLSSQNESSTFTFNITLNQNTNKSDGVLSPPFANENYTISEDKMGWNTLKRKVLRVEQCRHLWTCSVRKEKSPSVKTLINNSAPFTPTIDEGSEINVIDNKFCLRWNIKFIPTAHAAKAAGSSIMLVEGQTKKDILMNVLGCKIPISGT